MSTGETQDEERGSRKRIITTKRLREFFETHPECEKHKAAFDRWVAIVQEGDWRNWGDVRATFADADLADDLTVFNIGRNKYRVVAYVSFKPGTAAWVYIKFVGTHKEYDRLKL